MTEPSQPPFKKKQSNDYVRYSSIGFQMLGIIVMGVALGRLLDGYVMHNQSSWFTLGFTLLFVILSMAYAIRQITLMK